VMFSSGRTFIAECAAVEESSDGRSATPRNRPPCCLPCV
jgi:hypothetical protein